MGGAVAGVAAGPGPMTGTGNRIPNKPEQTQLNTD